MYSDQYEDMKAIGDLSPMQSIGIDTGNFMQIWNCKEPQRGGSWRHGPAESCRREGGEESVDRNSIFSLHQTVLKRWQTRHKKYLHLIFSESLTEISFFTHSFHCHETISVSVVETDRQLTLQYMQYEYQGTFGCLTLIFPSNVY